MPAPVRHRVDTTRFLHETFDGDTVIIDTVTGRLSVLSGLGADVWARLVAPTGVATEELLADVGATYGPAAADETKTFLDDVTAAAMLQPVDQPPSPDPLHAADDAQAASAPPWPAVYASPSLEVFDDIADIMTMDPIHDVDVSEGWPRAT